MSKNTPKKLLDGALGLWNLATDIFGDWKSPVTYILDIIHVRDYLWDAANALHDEGSVAGMPIATGVVESACGSVVKKRMEGGGKRWSMEGAEAILLLRSLDKSDDYENYWRFHIIQEGKRIYENSPKYSPIIPLANAA